MTFEEILEQAIAMLQRRGRLTYRALKRQLLLDSLVESLPSVRVLLLVNYRPEYQHG